MCVKKLIIQTDDVSRADRPRSCSRSPSLPQVSNPTTTSLSSSPARPVSAKVKITISNSKKIAPVRRIVPKKGQLEPVLKERDADFFSPKAATVRTVTPRVGPLATSSRDAPFGLGNLEVVDVQMGPTRKQVQTEKRRREELDAKRAQMVFDCGEETRRCGPKFTTFEVVSVSDPVRRSRRAQRRRTEDERDSRSSTLCFPFLALLTFTLLFHLLS